MYLDYSFCYVDILFTPTISLLSDKVKSVQRISTTWQKQRKLAL